MGFGCLSKPWRDVPKNSQENLTFLKDYLPEKVKHLRILLHGPVGAGKSSFINSVDSVFQGRISSGALVDTITGGRSFTKKYCAVMKGNASQPTDTIPKVMRRSQSKEFILDAFDKDWRKIPMSKDQYLDYVKKYQLHHDGIQQLRILLHGPAGSGKSSFINSVDTVLQGRMAGRALTDGSSGSSFTREYRTFKIQKEAQGTFYPFAFTDIMGLEPGKNRGVCVEDIKQAMKGHVKDQYQFNPSAAISKEDNGYNKTPSLNDKIHVLVFVVSAVTLSVMNPETMKKMREVRLAACNLRIPQLAVLTKIDEACPAVKEDVRNVYKSVKVKELMEKLSAELGIPPYCIFPVKNYHWENTPEDVSGRLILSALKQMIDFGDDFVNNHM